MRDNTIHIIASELMRANKTYRAGQAYCIAANQIDAVWMKQNVSPDPENLDRVMPVPDPFYLDENLPTFLIRWHEG